MKFSVMHVAIWLLSAQAVSSFAPSSARPRTAFLSSPRTISFKPTSRICATSNDDDKEEEEYKNPYQDENYPELEFVDYSDPNYVVDQGVSDEFFAAPTQDDTEVVIEAMREERRRRNDEYQFQTYYKEFLKDGAEYHGHWTVYRTSTFLDEMEDDPAGFPRFIKARRPIHVKSRGYKVQVKTESEFHVDGERICHEEVAMMVVDDDENQNDSPQARQTVKDVLSSTYWPAEMRSLDFRGQQGNMCVGTAYSICTAVPLIEDSAFTKTASHYGPFKEMRTEVGIQEDGLRMRIKLDYRVTDQDLTDYHITAASGSAVIPPKLRLKSMTVCREAMGMLPSIEGHASLFDEIGAMGGLYDPPPVGSDEQAGQYMLLDLEGGATTLFPYVMDQDPAAFDGMGWVTSLDWTPGNIRYQVDRKVHGGEKLLGLRTLEVSEVQKGDADTYRPRDGGRDMRQ
jgi:hypothetical protein